MTGKGQIKISEDMIEFYGKKAPMFMLSCIFALFTLIFLTAFVTMAGGSQLNPFVSVFILILLVDMLQNMWPKSSTKFDRKNFSEVSLVTYRPYFRRTILLSFLVTSAFADPVIGANETTLLTIFCIFAFTPPLLPIFHTKGVCATGQIPRKNGKMKKVSISFTSDRGKLETQNLYDQMKVYLDPETQKHFREMKRPHVEPLDSFEFDKLK